MILAQTLDLPSLSAWLYFVLHLLAVVAHVSAMFLLTLGWDGRSGLAPLTRFFGACAHIGSAVLHGVFAMVGFFNFRIRAPDGTVPLWMLLTTLVLAVGWAGYVLLAQRDLLVLTKLRGER